MVMFGLIVPNLKRVLSVVTCFLPQSHTCLEIEMASASSTLNTLEVKPSPRSLASQHLQAKIYLTPLVGTATDSSSTSQQLSGVAPSWPSCREAEKQSLCATWVYFSAGPCVYVNVTETLNAWLPPPSLPHLDLFDLPHVWTVGLEALQRAGLKALHPVWQVQPQPFCLGVIGPYDDHKSPAGGACVALQTGADGDVIRYDCTGRGRHLVIGARHNVKIVCVWRFFYVFLLGSSTSSSSFFFLFFLFMLLSTLFAVRAGFFLLFRPSRTPS